METVDVFCAYVVGIRREEEAKVRDGSVVDGFYQVTGVALGVVTTSNCREGSAEIFHHKEYTSHRVVSVSGDVKFEGNKIVATCLVDKG